jgi:hypothetical protein
MSRELRVRAWDRSKKEWVTAKLDSMRAWTISNGQHLSDDMEPWEQYTGLKDKNGKEIYEGDILIWVYEGKKIDGPSVVEYWEGDACWMEVPTLNGMSSAHCEHYEVIGNIHENPELVSEGTERA